MISSIGTLTAVIGALLVMLGNSTAANTIWMVSNPLLIYHNYSAGDIHQTMMFSFFFLAAFAGVILAIKDKVQISKGVPS